MGEHARVTTAVARQRRQTRRRWIAKAVVAVVVATTLAAVGVAGAVDEQLRDQTNDPPANNSASCTGSEEFHVQSLYQSVVPPPAPHKLGTVKLRLRAGSAVERTEYLSFIRIRSGSPTGPIVSTATSRLSPNPVGAEVLAEYQLVPAAAFPPGELAYIEFRTPPPTYYTWMFADDVVDPYPAGQAYGCHPPDNAAVEVAPFGDHDFNFITYRALLAADVAVSTSVSPATADIGEVVEQIIVVRNVGELPTSTAFGFSVAMTAPRGATLVGVTSPADVPCQVVNGTSLSCQTQTGGFAAGAERRVVVRVMSALEGPMALVARVSESRGNPTGNNEATATVVVRPMVGDADGDQLPDAWEVPGGGPDGDGDGQPDILLYDAPYHARPDHKDVFVELDWLLCQSGPCSGRSQRPLDSTVTALEGAFARGDVSNPDGTSGVRLHLMVDPTPTPDPGNALSFSRDGTDGPNVIDTTVDSVSDVKDGAEAEAAPCDGSFGTAEDRVSLRCAAILRAKRQVFRWGLFARSLGADDPPGGSADLPGDDMVVALDQFDPAQTPAAFGDRATLEQVVLMHELGHTLGLRHAGAANGPLCTPNYQSLMNQLYMYRYFSGRTLLDYSRDELATIDEARVPGNLNLGGTVPFPVVHFAFGRLVQPLLDSGVAQDWNDNDVDDGAVEQAIDTNFRRNSDGSTGNEWCGSPSPDETLRGFDDWANLIYNHRASVFSTAGVPGPMIEEVAAAHADEVDPTEEVEVDVRPERVNTSSRAVLAVAVLSSPALDARAIDPRSVCFGDADVPAERDCTEAHGRGHLEDADGDGDVDLVLHFETQQSGIDPGDPVACLTGRTSTGADIAGCDAITAREGPDLRLR